MTDLGWKAEGRLLIVLQGSRRIETVLMLNALMPDKLPERADQSWNTSRAGRNPTLAARFDTLVRRPMVRG